MLLVGSAAVIAFFFLLAGVGAWRRRGRSDADLLADQRNMLAARENQLRRQGHPWGQG
jgi:uncharacterized iron-regulated membrane protein